MPAHRWGQAEHPLLTLIALALSIVLGITTAWWAGGLSDDAAAAEDRAAWARLVMAVHQATAALEDELNVRAASALADPGAGTPAGRPVEAAARERRDAVVAVLPTLQVLGATDTHGRAARQLDELLSAVPADADQAPAMADVLDITAEAEDLLTTAAGSDEQALALLQLAGQASIPRLVASDVLDAVYVQAGGRAAAWAQDYFDGADAYLQDDGGWLDADPAGQLTSPYIPADALQAHRPQLWADLRAAMDGAAAAPLLAVDAWVRDWPQSRERPPPETVAVTLAAVEAVSAPVDALISATTQQVVEAEAAAAASARSRRTALLVLGPLLTLAAGGLAVRLGWQQWGRITGWRSAALTDPLTGLANRRALQAFATERPAAATATPRGGSALLLFDLDHFKAINDQYGHAVGDQALLAVADHARRVAAAMPGVTQVARIGGDEFVILAVGVADAAGAATRAAEDLVAAVSGIALADGGPQVPLSISVGVTTAPDDLPLEDLLLQADAALYDVKRSGRGSHRTHSAEDPSAI